MLPHHPGNRRPRTDHQEEQVYHHLALFSGKGKENQERYLHLQQTGSPQLLLHLGSQEKSRLDTRHPPQTLTTTLCTESVSASVESSPAVQPPSQTSFLGAIGLKIPFLLEVFTCIVICFNFIAIKVYISIYIYICVCVCIVTCDIISLRTDV